MLKRLIIKLTLIIVLTTPAVFAEENFFWDAVYISENGFNTSSFPLKDPFTLTPLTGGKTLVNSGEIILRENLDFNFKASASILFYNFTGAKDVARDWGIGIREEKFSLQFGGVRRVSIISNFPSFSITFGEFNPGFNRFFYAPPLNPSAFGQELLPTSGVDFKFNSPHLYIELAKDLNLKLNDFYAVKGELRFNKYSLGVNFLWGENASDYEKLWGLEGKVKLKKSTELFANLGASSLTLSHTTSLAFEVGLDKEFSNLITKASFIYIPLDYDTFQFHQSLSRYSWQGEGKYFPNRKGIILEGLYLNKNWEVSSEVRYLKALTSKDCYSGIRGKVSYIKETSSLSLQGEWWKQNKQLKLAYKKKIKSNLTIGTNLGFAWYKKEPVTQYFVPGINLEYKLSLKGFVVAEWNKFYYYSSSHWHNGNQLITSLKVQF